MKKIQVENTPLPVGHYSQAIVSNGFVFTSGILPIKILTSEKLSAESSIEEQLNLVLENLQIILESAESSIEKVVKTTVYIADMEKWNEVNKIYAEFFGSHRPARSIVPVNDLHFGYKIEIEAVAEV